MKTLSVLWISLMTVCLGMACHSDHSHEDPAHEPEEAHGHEDPAHEPEEAHGHDHGKEADFPSEVVTVWGEKTQLFVEFPRLVTGHESPMAAHLTLLVGHLPISAGTVIVELSGGGAAPERFSVSGAASSGIFRPVVKPAHGGRRTVTLQLESEGLTETHVMGEFEVFSTEDDAKKAPVDHDGHDGNDAPDAPISYLLEQQWVVPFGITQASIRPLRPTLAVFGELVRPTDAETTVFAPRDGRLGDVAPWALGTVVQLGAPLCRISGPSIDGADKTTLDLTTEQTAIRVKTAAREVDRLRPLVAQGIVPQKRLQEAQSVFAEAQAEQSAARRRLKQWEESQAAGGAVDGFAVVAPMAGVIAETFAVAGSWVSQGDPLVRIINPQKLWLDVAVPETYIDRLKSVSGVFFRPHKSQDLVELDHTTPFYVGTEVDPQSRTLRIRFPLNDIKPGLIAGLFVSARLVTDAPQSKLTIPYSAVVDDGGMTVVYVQAGGETFVRRPVLLGIRDGDWVEVQSGMAEDEWVVTTGAYSVKLASLSTESVGDGHAH